MPERFVIGSALGCSIRVRTDPRVEPQHCEITSGEDGGWYIQDLGTRAGTTYLMTACEPERPGQVIVSITPRRILTGDTIVIGWTKIVWPGRIMGAHPSFKDAPEFVLRPPAGWMNRVDELLVHHGAVDHHNSYLGGALANLLRSWWDGVDTGTDGAAPEWWGPRTREEAAAVNAPKPTMHLFGDDSDTSECCGRTRLETPNGDWFTSNPDMTTCQGGTQGAPNSPAVQP